MAQRKKIILAGILFLFVLLVVMMAANLMLREILEDSSSKPISIATPQENSNIGVSSLPKIQDVFLKEEAPLNHSAQTSRKNDSQDPPPNKEIIYEAPIPDVILVQ